MWVMVWDGIITDCTYYIHVFVIQKGIYIYVDKDVVKKMLLDSNMDIIMKISGGMQGNVIGVTF